jgi:hypothetical protein
MLPAFRGFRELDMRGLWLRRCGFREFGVCGLWLRGCGFRCGKVTDEKWRSGEEFGCGGGR